MVNIPLSTGVSYISGSCLGLSGINGMGGLFFLEGSAS